MHTEIDNQQHCAAFVRLNEQWIERYFTLEDADRRLAADPYQVVREGGHILSLIEDQRVVGVCALVKESANRFELAKMAVEPTQQGKGYGDVLMRAAISKALEEGATISTSPGRRGSWSARHSAAWEHTR